MCFQSLECLGAVAEFCGFDLKSIVIIHSNAVYDDEIIHRTPLTTLRGLRASAVNSEPETPIPRGDLFFTILSRRSDLNRRPILYERIALPLSYSGRAKIGKIKAIWKNRKA
jgi:hypothetical protein